MSNSSRLYSELLRSLKFFFAVSLVLICLTSTFAGFTSANKDEGERKHAFQLFKDGNYVEALPSFEKLAVSTPNDPQIVETLGLLVLSQAIYLRDAGQRKQARLRARNILVRAGELGADDALLKTMLAAIPADGGEDISFSLKKEVDEAMREGEGAFAKGDYAKAAEAYQRALLLDPKLYTAALFTGDVYYQMLLGRCLNEIRQDERSARQVHRGVHCRALQEACTKRLC